MYTNKYTLCIMGFKSFIKSIFGVTHHKLYTSVLTAANEVGNYFLH